MMREIGMVVLSVLLGLVLGSVVIPGIKSSWRSRQNRRMAVRSWGFEVGSPLLLDTGRDVGKIVDGFDVRYNVSSDHGEAHALSAAKKHAHDAFGKLFRVTETQVWSAHIETPTACTTVVFRFRMVDASAGNVPIDKKAEATE